MCNCIIIKNTKGGNYFLNFLLAWIIYIILTKRFSYISRRSTTSTYKVYVYSTSYNNLKESSVRFTHSFQEHFFLINQKRSSFAKAFDILEVELAWNKQIHISYSVCHTGSFSSFPFSSPNFNCYFLWSYLIFWPPKWSS